MIAKSIDQITKEDIESLVAAKVSERRTLDYKAQLNVSNDGDRREFLADVSSFANAAGGDIIFGISEERDANGKSTGLPGAADGITLPNASEVILRLENLIRDGIEPRIPGIQCQQIEGFPKGPVLVIRIPKSWLVPHMVTFAGLSRFFARSNAGKHQLDLGEIRSAFLAQAAVGERIKRFVTERIAKTMQGESPIPLDGAKVLLHLVPLSALDATSVRDIVKAAARLSIDLKPMNAGGWGSRFNFEGVLVSNWHSNTSYVQIFRSGVIEAGDAEMFQYDKLIPSISFEETIIAASDRYLRAQKKLEVPPPIFLAITLLGVKGFKLSVDPSIVFRLATPPVPVDRDILELPEVLIEDYDTSIDQVLRPAFDTLWQTCGFQQSFNYAQNGEWNPNHRR